MTAPPPKRRCFADDCEDTRVKAALSLLTEMVENTNEVLLDLNSPAEHVEKALINTAKWAELFASAVHAARESAAPAGEAPAAEAPASEAPAAEAPAAEAPAAEAPAEEAPAAEEAPEAEAPAEEDKKE